MALSLNRRLADFFKEYAEKFTETQGKRILLNFASREEEHNDLIRQRTNESLGVSEV